MSPKQPINLSLFKMYASKITIALIAIAAAVIAWTNLLFNIHHVN